MDKIDKLIINGPYEVPAHHWQYRRETQQFTKEPGRRPAGYMRATPNAKGFDDPGVFEPIELVNAIRGPVDEWRAQGYPGITLVTRRLLEHWQDTEQRRQRFFFCQLEAIETLIWLVETPEGAARRKGIAGDGGPFERLCSKLATGTGKTIVMAMIIAWNFLNKAANPEDGRFSNQALIVAPGLTVKERLQVLMPEAEDSYYQVFDLAPAEMMPRLRQGQALICNWHALAWDTQEKLDAKARKGQLRSVDKRRRRELSDAAYIRQTLGPAMAPARNLLVINDEAHHAWRVNPDAKGKYTKVGADRDSAEEATVWMGGLDRIHRQCGILRCFDLSATPFTPTGKQTAEASLFNWIVSDFGLNDAIESGLVKTPRVAIRDDGKLDAQYRSRLYHIYVDPEVRDDLGRSRSQVKETQPLPDLVRNAYLLLGEDWRATRDSWRAKGHPIPPVMITVANSVPTSGRIAHAFKQGGMAPDAQLGSEEGLLRIDTDALKAAEKLGDSADASESGQGRKDREAAERLRQQVSSVGLPGKPGEQVCNVISVAMLSEGWDAKNVTHIMGLRAFTSQLLCEQVVGRGLRRINYDNLDENGRFPAEYVNIFGVPFTFLPHEEPEGPPPPPPPPATRIEPLDEKRQHAMAWPNVVRIDHCFKPTLRVDWSQVAPLLIDPFDLITKAELDAIVAGKPHKAVTTRIGIDRIGESLRLQTIVFRIAKAIYDDQGHDGWQGDAYSFLAQLIPLVEEFVNSGKIAIKDDLFSEEGPERKVLVMLNLSAIIRHLWQAIHDASTEDPSPVFDQERPIGATGDMRPWYTTRPCASADKSHISHSVFDSRWEASEAYALDNSKHVRSFVKNDHLGFAVFYSHQGIVRKHYPDYLIRLVNGEQLALEVKGQKSDQAEAKRLALEEWCKAVNAHGDFGRWRSAVSYHPKDLEGILVRHSS